VSPHPTPSRSARHCAMLRGMEPCSGSVGGTEAGGRRGALAIGGSNEGRFGDSFRCADHPAGAGEDKEQVAGV